jgi:hypothetical protein
VTYFKAPQWYSPGVIEEIHENPRSEQSTSQSRLDPSTLWLQVRCVVKLSRYEWLKSIPDWHMAPKPKSYAVDSHAGRSTTTMYKVVQI